MELPPTPYPEVWELQLQLMEARRSGQIDVDIVLAVEHLPVFTLGRRGGREHLRVSDPRLDQAQIPIVQVERGGNITYHGPRQLVIYPIWDLKRAGLGVAAYVHALEEVMLRTAAAWGVQAERNPLNRGVWVGPRKLGSLGIAVRRGIAFHGLALNVDPDLTPFGWISPCGLPGVGTTSLARERGAATPMAPVRRSARAHLADVLAARPEPMALAELQTRLA